MKKYLISISLISVVLLSACTNLGAPAAWHGSVIDPPTVVADFTLTDQHGQPFRLSDQRGHPVLMFFGYTSCPDVCPLTLATFKQVYQQLGDQASGVRFVFITVDPAVDTPQQLQSYLANFEPAFIGLTGSPAALQGVWQYYGVYQAKKDGSQTVEHSSSIYLIDPQGRWRVLYDADAKPGDLLEDLRRVMVG